MPLSDPCHRALQDSQPEPKLSKRPNSVPSDIVLQFCSSSSSHNSDVEMYRSPETMRSSMYLRSNQGKGRLSMLGPLMISKHRISNSLVALTLTSWKGRMAKALMAQLQALWTRLRKDKSRRGW